jgi:hypothetical protein
MGEIGTTLMAGFGREGQELSTMRTCWCADLCNFFKTGIKAKFQVKKKAQSHRISPCFVPLYSIYSFSGLRLRNSNRYSNRSANHRVVAHPDQSHHLNMGRN